jgi:hypothetical protein
MFEGRARCTRMKHGFQARVIHLFIVVVNRDSYFWLAPLRWMK